MASWLSGWAYRRPVRIDNTGNPSNLTNYQVLVTVDTASLISAGKMRPDCGDIRFTDIDGVTLLPYWIESGINTTTTKIWVKVPAIPASSIYTIYMYYGNPDALSQSNGDNTFDFFDDFPGISLDTTKWPTTGGAGTLSVSNGLLTLTNPKYIGSAKSYAGGYAFRAKVKVGTDTTGLSWGGFTTTISSTQSADLTLAWYYSDTATYFRFLSGNGSSYQVIDSGIARETANYHIVEARRTGTADRFQIDNDTEKTGSYPTNTARYLTFYAYSADIVVDWVLLRKYIPPDPSTSLDPEEVPPAPAPPPAWLGTIDELKKRLIFTTTPSFLSLSGSGSLNILSPSAGTKTLTVRNWWLITNATDGRITLASPSKLFGSLLAKKQKKTGQEDIWTTLGMGEPILLYYQGITPDSKVLVLVSWRED